MIDILKPLIKKFMPYAQKQMGFSRPPKLFLQNDTQNASDPLGKTGFYDPHNESITLYITNRHPKDVMRSLAHELMHHTQKCNGDFDNVGNVGEQGYAQSDPHMRTMEIQAYKASIVFRDWEDSLKETIYYEHLQKGDKKMSTKNWKNKELNGLLMERFGFGFKPLLEEEIEEAATGSRIPNRAKEQCERQGKKMVAGKCVDPDTLEEEKGELEEMCPHEDEADMVPDDGEEVEGGIEALVATALAAVHELAAAVGVDIPTDVEAGADMDMDIELVDDEALEESPSHPAEDREGPRGAGRRVKKSSGERSEG